MEQYLKPTEFLNFDEREIREMIQRVVESSTTEKEKASVLFNFVRDRIPYNPYQNIFKRDIYKANTILNSESNFCVPKAILLTAMCRGAGIPARLRFASIRNRLMSEKLLSLMKSDVIHGHGFSEIYINGAWIQATPAFDSELSTKNGYTIVTFDGENHSILPSHDVHGNPHVEYLWYSESFDDFPLEWYIEYVRSKYDGFTEEALAVWG
ncbi:MAG TPA: transglutaminase family protein [Spirochaetota bacterium]|nr:transglutaminase family protein [Spirochaetota bacterium]HQP49233.1 transglutaminase family protein [Spirochaetota bacterium]